MEKIFKNKELAASVRTLTKSYGTVYFCAKDIATSMGYANTKNAIKRHVEYEYKVTAGDLVRGSSRAPLRGNGSVTIYVAEPSVYQLIFGSELKVAKEFRLWVLEDVLPKQRVTGKVELRKRFGKEIECASEAETKKEVRVEREVCIRSELDLQIRVVNYIRRFYPSAIIFAGLGKLQDTVEKRKLSKCQGYTRGKPDITIMNGDGKYSGFCIEMKSPTGLGKFRADQYEPLEKMKEEGYKTLLSNDYELVIHEITRYFSGYEEKCRCCGGNFKNEAGLDEHVMKVHTAELEARKPRLLYKN
jgi:prophage antirepressor-like protein